MTIIIIYQTNPKNRRMTQSDCLWDNISLKYEQNTIQTLANACYSSCLVRNLWGFAKVRIKSLKSSYFRHRKTLLLFFWVKIKNDSVTHKKINVENMRTG